MTLGNAPLWSVLIATLTHREEKLLGLLRSLLPQAETCPVPVEVVALRNYGEKAISQYRQALLDDAQGMYVSFVDDDDDVFPHYVAAITAALELRPDVVGFEAECRGLLARKTLMSVKYWGACWDSVMQDGERVYLRYITHLCPVRTELARQAGFPGEFRYGEDTEYSSRLHGVLEATGVQQIYIPSALYRYNWSGADSSVESVMKTSVAPIVAHRRMQRRPLPPVFSPCFRWHPWSAGR